MRARKLKRRMWGVFDTYGTYRNPMSVHEYRSAARADAKIIAMSYDDVTPVVRPALVTWAAPKPKRGKR